MGDRRYFGTDGIRGRVGEGPIAADFVLRLGNALGRVLAAGSGKPPLVVIGKDTRVSGYMFEAALEAGLVAAGAHVRLLGPMPTPGVAHLTRSLRASAGIVISASHNPHYDNGIKFFSANGEKLDDATEAAIEAALDDPFTTVESEHIGKVERVRDAVTRYVEFCKSTVPVELSLTGLSIGMDCAHGATYQTGPKLFTELGAKVSAIGDEPDGLNINLGVGSTHIEALCEHVRATGQDLGIAFDGDGDRVQFVDGQGHALDGDDILFVLAMDWYREGRLKGPVVGTLMTNYGLEKAFATAGIGFVRSRVGDRYVHQQLIAHGGNLGGETSGHILCLDRAGTGDGAVSALQVLEVVQRSGKTLAQLREGFTKVPQKTVNIRLANGSRPLEAPSVKHALAAAEEQLSGRGRAFMRPSGTEPVVRVTVEAGDAAEMERLLAGLSDAVRAAV